MRRQLTERLAGGLATLGLALIDSRRQLLLDYIALLHKWNRAYNLTAVRDPAAMLAYHLFDSLTVLPYLGGARVIDVGSGAGLPGIPLAIASPERTFVLLDSNGKKTRFCVQAVGELGLDNVSVVRARLEDYRPAQPFDTVVSRAFTGISRFAEGGGPLVARNGKLLAMVGRLRHGAVGELAGGFQVAAVTALSVPELNAERHLVDIRKA